MKTTRQPLYQRFAEQLRASLENGVLRPGDRLSSVRQAATQHGLSITTVVRAYELLESSGLIESHPQSGYFVRARFTAAALPASPDEPGRSMPLPVSAEVDVSRHVLATLKSIHQHDAVPLGSPYPDPLLFPAHRISQYHGSVLRSGGPLGVLDDLPPGHPELIRQIVRRHLETGLSISPDDVVVTVGATEAINLCLQAVAKAGDTIAVESPTFYAMLHAIERLGMRAIEVPTDPRLGMDIAALSKIMQSQPVAACMVMPNFQNPLGFEMPEENKRQLVELGARYNMPIIENGVYNELYFGNAHPSVLKAYDKRGMVLYCSSFSKSLTSAYRIGWTLPGRYRAQVEKLKFLNTLSTSSLPQRAIAAYLTAGGYDRHLRRVRRTLQQRCDIMSAFVGRFFPAGTRITRPSGGYVLWIELPAAIDSMALYRQALAEGITIAPGRLFSTSDAYRSFIRLNYSYSWTPQIELALRRLSELAADMLD
ncbi:PLP-dependent aminotransferase family protein [Collimonas sp.]|uniref:aminotransferase-like domain-containing protein n=1 Tax=Collimonas sp. TaxID=1963772 RepID=UPI002C800748|nr:PLP-dependent aminotransferase family protein [Collimonas sp.]HWX03042.1 PLP-dependent aminotransferase family protein [Collimonas sp.]